MRRYELAHDSCDFVNLGIECEVTSVEYMHFSFRHILAVALRLARIE